MQTPSGVVTVPPADKAVTDVGHTTDHNSISRILSALEVIERGSLIDNFEGATTDLKLADAISKGVKAIAWGPRPYSLANQYVDLPDGTTFLGVPGGGNPEQGSKATSLTKITTSFAGTVFNFTVSKWNIGFRDIDWIGTSNTVFCNTPTATAWAWNWDWLAWNNYKSILGTPTNKALLTACLICPTRFSIANGSDTAATVGGSDNDVFSGYGLVDSGVSVTNKFHFIFDNLQKSTFGTPFITCRLGWGGILGKGSLTNGSANTIKAGIRIEGRNQGDPCPGALVRIEGGGYAFHGIELFYGMANPGSTTRTDAGYLHHTGGITTYQNIWVAPATGVAETVPAVYATGAGTRVYAERFFGVPGGGAYSWIGQPRSQAVAGATITNLDGSLTAI